MINLKPLRRFSISRSASPNRPTAEHRQFRISALLQPRGISVALQPRSGGISASLQPAKLVNWTAGLTCFPCIFLTFAQKLEYFSYITLNICIIITSAPNGLKAGGRLIKMVTELKDPFFLHREMRGLVSGGLKFGQIYQHIKERTINAP